MYTDYDKVKEFLTDSRFKIVPDPTDAKILWMTSDYEQKKFMGWDLDEDKIFVNFFKKEAAFVMKHHLANMLNATL